MKLLHLTLLFQLGWVIPAFSQEDPACRDMAQAFKHIYFGFPDLKEETIEQIVSWKASCAKGPPQGRGNVVALCLAEIQGDGHVFYWTKAAVEAETSGYEICDY
jgi:hypothetical protein